MTGSRLEEKTRTAAIWAGLAGTAALAGVAALVPGAWLWGGDTLRWQPALGGALWVLFALSLVPSVARGVASRIGQTIGPWCGDHLSVLLAGMASCFVLVLPDHVHFLGDFLLRQGSAEMLVEPGRLAPQALPLDQLLHYGVPVWLHERFGIPPNATGRGLGALSAALTALAAASLARRLAPRQPGWQWALATALTFGGWCLLLTGYAKAFVEMVWILPMVAALALRALESPRAFLGLSALVTLALLLHRSALGLLPVWGFLAWWQVRRRGTGAGAAMVGAAPVLSASIWLVLRVAGSFEAVDRAHFTATNWLDPLRLLDVGNALWAVVPLLPVLAVAVWDTSAWRHRSGQVAALLALPYIGLALVLSPQQGPFRDLDTYALPGMAIATLLAVLLAGGVRNRRLASWLAVPLTVGALTLTVPSVALQTNLDAGLARIVSWVEGPPLRSESVRALTLDYVGVRLLHAQRYPEATASLARAARLGPSPRLLLEWAVAAETARDWDGVEAALSEILERAESPAYGELRLVAYLGLAKVAGRRGERARLEELAAAAQNLAPGNRIVVEMLREARALALEAEQAKAALPVSPDTLAGGKRP